MICKNNIEQTVAEFLQNTGCFLIDVNVSAENRVVVEIDSDAGVSLDFCIALNRHIEAKFDRDAEDYELEVCSAGLTEPFKNIRQYRKNIGNSIEIIALDGKKMKGILKSVENDYFILTVEKTVKPEGAKRKTTVYEDILLKYSEIKYARYDLKF